MKYKLIAPMNPRFSTIEQVLRNRGIQDIQHYLNTTDADILDPKLLANIQEAAKMLVKHISNQSNIFIIVDGDADGYTSASTLINYLYELFPTYVRAHLKYAMHPGKEHGIDLDMIPNEYTTLEGDDLMLFNRLITLLNDVDDVQNIYHNVENADN